MDFSLEKIPNINLYNFEDKKFEKCDYILTSPLSLKACKNLGIKPQELLSNNTFDEKSEKLRKINLDRAREERNKLLDAMTIQPLVVNGRLISQDAIQDQLEAENKLPNDRSFNGSYSGETEGSTSNQYNYPKNSYLKEISFQQKRRELQEMEQEDKNDLKRNIEMKIARAQRNKEILQKKKYREIEVKREQFENKAKNVSARRRRLDNEIQNYHLELEKFQHISLQNAAEKSSKRIHCDLERIQSEREVKDQMIRYKRHLLEEENEMKKQDLVIKIVERDRQDDEFIQKKFEKMMESRCLANEAQKLREELRQVYNLDSFDKKVSQVEAINRVLK